MRVRSLQPPQSPESGVEAPKHNPLISLAPLVLFSSLCFLSFMRRATVVGETLSHWRISTRRRPSDGILNRLPRPLTPNLTGRRRHSSVNSSIPRRRSESRPRQIREPRQHHTPQEFHSSSTRLNATAAHVEESPENASEEVPVSLHQWNSIEEEDAYSEQFYAFLESGQPNQVMAALTDPRSAGLVGSLPQIVFVEALHRLSPSHFVDPYRILHHPLHSWSVMSHGLQRIEEIFDQFVHSLLTVTRYRTAAGHSLQLAEYTHLLDCARSMGNAPFAEMIWDAMQDRRVSPDGTCYNHYMEAVAWDHCYTGREAYHLRMLPYSYFKRRRRAEARTVGWKGYGTAGWSVRRAVNTLFADMLDDGHIGDERTYINLMIASARVGARPGILHVLQTAWNVNVEALEHETNPSKLPPVTPHDPGSALYPTENLLFAVAHALGTNNDIPGAVRTIQFFSYSYNVPITARVWHELFERAYVLSRKGELDDRPVQEANKIGSIDVGVVRQIFDTMTSEPYNVTPTMQIWRFMINIAMDMGSLEDVKRYLREAYGLLTQTRQRENQAREAVERCLAPALETARSQFRQGATRADPELFQSPLLAEAIQAYDIVRLEAYQQAYLLRRVVWVAVRVPRWQDMPEKVWHLQERPKFMEEWDDFMPDRKTIFYDENSGFMEMIGPTGFPNRFWTRGEHVAVRRRTDNKTLFHADEQVAPLEGHRWGNLLARKHPYVDKTLPPLNRLLNFQLAQSAEFKEAIKKLSGTWVDYPEGHPYSQQRNPRGGFWGRLAALGMLKPKQRGIYLLDEHSWI